MPDGSPRKPDHASSPTPPTKPRFVNLVSPGRLDMEFFCEVAKGLLSFSLFGQTENRTAQGRTIDETFAAFSLAVPQDTDASREALERIRELGVRAVRIDCSEETSADALIPLLEGLQAAGVAVLLHLVQPLSQAGEMPEDSAVQAWKQFVERALNVFSAYVEAVEIGTTINRAKWSGYSLAGFLAAWETAYPLVKGYGLTVVGPNVTDFEPQYNAGALGMLKRRGILPDIHSNNMFAERTIEPEALDRKILGETFKRLHGYDLIKKLGMVAWIGRRYGVERHWSTCAFWTLPRIERILANAEDQKADYLVRYYILCVSQGSFERFYWGPLVSRREGLLDDGTGLPEDRSVRDVVSYYRELPGQADQWRRRPSFSAFKTLYARLSGARYLKRLRGGEGLEIHAFEKGSEQFHVVWTKNGALAPSAGIYGAEDLAALSSVSTRDGQRLDELPDYFSESPLYLFWPLSRDIVVKPEAAVLPKMIAARPDPGSRYFAYRSGEWRGTVCARSREQADRLIERFKPDSIGSPVKESTLRQARNVIWSVENPLDPAQALVVKKPVRVAWHKRILDRRKPSKSLRSWNGTSELQRRGIETPKVVAYFEHEDPARVLDNWFICEHAGTHLSARRFFAAYARGEDTVEGFTFEAFARQLIAFIRSVHKRGVYFRDLSGGNVLVRVEKGGKLVFSLIDTARARFSGRRFTRSQRVADLKRLVFKLNPHQQSFCMKTYLEEEGVRFTFRYRLSFKLYAIKASLKRLKRKARKRLCL
ncbi:hypothetical protein DDZ13_13635 [Coraliomargarita sinensis]|uniref:Protein kinase domain-containing protein n=1 Tax=Coraliomargarita sinensis TaxID=2174842 RepID=A0A317ZCZ5_9BACT|nr:lipopolysaccharide kinase InaA family protein [Coraliomargarita sinensis]PXA03104.1 hypothetical protein DDZ13_13635 [Coraliomargarita sinensis]